MYINPILNTDSYKTSHFLQYPPGTKKVSSYIEARPVPGIHEVVFFGLQMFLLDYLSKKVTYADILEASAFCSAHGVPFNKSGWEVIVDEYEGYLPLRITALPEGTVVPPGTPLVQVVNTDDRLAWLTSYIETAMLRAVWYPSTVATNSREVKKRIWSALEESSEDPSGQIPFKLHDFGARGTAAYEQAGIGGCAHLVNFMGSDTLTGVFYANKFYNESMAGFSIPAAEHSTMTSWGRDHEVEAYRNMLTSYPTGLVAVVSDSYDICNAVDHIWGETLKDEVLNRDGVLVIRPDSGDPVEMVLWCLEALQKRFGGRINSKGFFVLNDKVRVIQGDGVDKESIGEIIHAMLANGYSMDNVAFGMGAGLLQHVNRDTLRFAMKASAIRGPEGWYGVNKEPKTDMGKSSKKGVQHVVLNAAGTFEVSSTSGPEIVPGEQLKPVYEMRSGMKVPRIVTDTFKAIRERAAL